MTSIVPALARRAAVLSGAIVLLVILVVVSLMVGARTITASDVLSILTGIGPPPDSIDSVVLRTLRLPRTILGVVVGAALGAAGVLIQTLTRNPLADPGILGINAGSSLLVVLSITVFGWTGALATAGAGMLGAGAALIVVIALSWRGGTSPLRLVLAGTAFAAALSGVTSAIVIFDAGTLDQVRFWSLGSLAGRDTGLIWPAIGLVGIALLAAIALAIPLNTLSLGDDMARSLGTSVARVRLASLVTIALLCGTATAVAGPIGFVGLTVPFIARAIGGADTRWMLGLSIVLGALLLLGADVVGRLAAGTGELEVGIVVSVVGAPIFIALARRTRALSP
ncbi:iron chelate uptake ABC transporter family permease subunit [soil metagenome]